MHACMHVSVCQYVCLYVCLDDSVSMCVCLHVRLHFYCLTAYCLGLWLYLSTIYSPHIMLCLSVHLTVCCLSLSISVCLCVLLCVLPSFLYSSVFIRVLVSTFCLLPFLPLLLCVSLHPCVPVPALFSIGVITPISISTSRHFTAPSISLFHPSSPCPGQPICSPPLPSRPVSLCPSLQPPPPPPPSVSLTLTHCHRRLFPISYAHRYLPFDRFVDYNVPPAPRESSHTTDAKNDCRMS